MKRAQLQIKAPERINDGEALYDLLGKVFATEAEDYFKLTDECRKVLGNPAGHFDWNSSRISLMEDQLVTSWGVWDYKMRVGKTRLRVAGIGCVATDGRWRKQGLMTKTIKAAKLAMRQAGYDVSILFGIPDFYRRYGYVRAWSDSAILVAVGELGEGSLESPLRKFSLENNQEANDLYNRCHSRFAGTSVRPTYRRHYSMSTKAYRWVGKGKQLRGYIRVNEKVKPGILSCFEAAGETGEILAAAAILARRLKCREVRFLTIPWQHPLLIRLRRGNCRVETSYHRDGEALIHSLNLRQTLGKMSSELSTRLKASAFNNWRGKLQISGPYDKVGLKLDQGLVSVIPAEKKIATDNIISGREFTSQLLIGTNDPLETVEWGRIKLPGETRQLLPVLFPKLYPMLSGWDRY